MLKFKGLALLLCLVDKMAKPQAANSVAELLDEVVELTVTDPNQVVVDLAKFVDAETSEFRHDLIRCSRQTTGAKFLRMRASGALYDRPEVNDFCMSRPILRNDQHKLIASKINEELARRVVVKNYTLVIGDFEITGDMTLEWGDGRLGATIWDSTPNQYHGTVSYDLTPIDGELDVFGELFFVANGKPEISIGTLDVGRFHFERARIIRMDNPRGTGKGSSLTYERKRITGSIYWLSEGYDLDQVVDMINVTIYPRKLTFDQIALLATLPKYTEELDPMLEEAGFFLEERWDDELGGDFQIVVKSGEYMFAGSFLNGNVAYNGYVYDAVGDVVARVEDGRVIE